MGNISQLKVKKFGPEIGSTVRVGDMIGQIVAGPYPNGKYDVEFRLLQVFKPEDFVVLKTAVVCIQCLAV